MRSAILFLIFLISRIALSQQQMGTYMAYGPEAKYFSGLNFSVYQAANGYLWIGTQNGLVRFDGKRYKNYFPDHTNPDSPTDNAIMDIVEDKNGDLWFAGFSHGVTRYNQRTGQFKKYPALSKDHFPVYTVYSLLKDSGGDLWFATGGRGMAMYDYSNDSFLLYYPEPSKCRDGSVRGDNYVTDIAEDKRDKNIFWISTFKGLFSFNKQTKQFEKHSKGLPETAGTTVFNSVETDSEGNLWAGTWGGGLQFFNIRLHIFEKAKSHRSPQVVYDIKRINDSILYAACLNDGLYEINSHSGTFKNITPPRNPADPTINEVSIQRVSVTPGAGIFIGGNYYLYQQHPAYTRLKKNVLFPGVIEGEPAILLTGIVWDEKRQQYWITTLNGKGVYTASKDLRMVIPVVSDKKSPGEYAFYQDPVIDRTGKLWLLNRNNKICAWDSSQKIVDRVKEKDLPAISVLQDVWRLATDSQGNLWMMSGENFICHNPVTGKTERYPVEWDKEYKGPHDLRAAELKFDPDGNAWLISRSGLFHCRRNQEKVFHFYKAGNREKDLSSGTIVSGVFNKYKNFWITGGSGIQVFDWENDTVKANHDLSGGLPSMQVTSLATDSSGMIWAASIAGIMRFDPSKKIWQLFNRLDGMERDYLDGDMYVTSNDKLVIDQQDGLLLKDVKEIGSGSAVPAVHITAIFVNNQEYKDRLLPEYIDHIELGYNQNNVDIEFAAMDWLYPFKTNYRYRVDGVTPGAGLVPNMEARISLPDLQPGKYPVHIRALSSNGQFSKEIVFTIVIRPPFWKTRWFILLCLALLIAIIGWLYRYRIRQLKKTYEMRTAIARDLHDEIGSTLSNINILNELAKRNREDPARSTQYLDKAGEDIQRISESLGDIVWNINPRYDDLQNLFIRMKRYASDMMDGKNISYRVNFPEDAGKLSLSMGRRRDFYLIFKEAINNLVKYSKATVADVTVESDSRKLRMVIKDNGVGFDSNQTQHGNGIHNMHQRAKSGNDFLQIKSAPGKGTEVVLEMNST